jgi:hypothetical protein
MGLKQEEVYPGWTYSTSRNYYSEIWFVDTPLPSTVFVKKSICDHVLFGENGCSRDRHFEHTISSS